MKKALKPSLSDKRIEDFLDVIVAERGASPRTVAAYRSDLEDLKAYLLARSVKIERAGKKDLESYMQTVAKNGLSPRTQARRLSIYTTFAVLKLVRSRDLRAEQP